MLEYYEADWGYESDCDLIPYMDELVYIDNSSDLDHARDHMQSILKALYGNGSLEELENSLEEVLYILKIKMPSGNLCIRKEAL